MTADKQKADLSEIINKIIEGKIDANRRYIDEVLEKIQGANRKYYLEKLAIEVRRLEAEENAGNLQGAFHHKVMIDTYKGILERTFADT